MRGQSSCGNPGAPTAKEVLAELRKLADTRPTTSHYPIEWAASAYFYGDMTALAVLTLRAER